MNLNNKESAEGRPIGSAPRFAGKVCVVTGAASGIGLATARRLVEEAGTVVGLDIAPPAHGEPDKIEWRRHDVTSETDWTTAVSDVVAQHGRIDVLVNNAGLVGSYASLTDITVDDWRHIVEVNQTGVFLGIRAVVPRMLAAGTGAIVNVSSIWGLVGTAGVAAYQASKGAVTLITRNAAATWAEQGIRVNSVHPGLIVTPMTEAQDQAISAELVAKTPMRRAGQAGEVAAAIVFLASADAAYITGAQLVVDGGFTTV
jgi:hypothetical protein